MQLFLAYPQLVNYTPHKLSSPTPSPRFGVSSKSVLQSKIRLKPLWGANLQGFGGREMSKLNQANALEEEDAVLVHGSLDSSSGSSFKSLESVLNKSLGLVKVIWWKKYNNCSIRVFIFATFDSLIGSGHQSKWLVAGLFGLIILWKHDAEVLWAATGSIINSYVSITLKKILNHERPSGLRSDPGMPSSHAQSIFYVSVFALLSLIQWLGVNFLTMSLGAAIITSGTYFSWLRVSQQFHTKSQVLVGAFLGTVISIAWFWLWHAYVYDAFVSSIWVRIVIVLGSISLCTAFVIYVIQNWLSDERI